MRACAQTHTHTHTNTHTNKNKNRQTDGHKKEKNVKNQHFCNVGPPDTQYLYYSLDVESATLKGSLLPASTR